MNYLLKMPSDLDYLAEYVAIKNAVGFPLVRNPFCVPYPLEEGQRILNGGFFCGSFLFLGVINFWLAK